MLDLLSPESWIDSYRPTYPLAADDPRQGVYRMKRTAAVKRMHIEANTAGQMNFLTFDVDHDEAQRHVQALAWDAEAIPEPSWITSNPFTGHAHVGYVLADGVVTSPAARPKPLAYAADIQRTMTARMGADQAYSGLLSRNPLHPFHTTTWGRSKPYELAELHEALGTLVKAPRATDKGAQGVDVSLGRNNALFARVSHRAHTSWARHALHPEQGLGRDSHTAEVMQFAHESNAAMFSHNPLPEVEIRAMVRSACNWTWKAFDEAEFGRRQAVRSKRRDVYRARKDRVKIIQDTAESGHIWTAEQVAETFNVSRTVAFRYLKEAGVSGNRTDAQVLTVGMLREEGKTYNEIAAATGLTRDQVRYAAKKYTDL